MSEDFLYSFGGDGGPDEAFLYWDESDSWKTLHDLLANGFHHCSFNYVEIVSLMPTDYRAGFERREGTWAFTYFVAGD